MDSPKLQLSQPAEKYGVRHVQALIMALASFMIYALRISLSVAIVAMTDTETKADLTNQNFTIGSNDTTHNSVLNPIYDWDEGTQGMVLSSFFWGYLITQIPAGILTQRLGAHKFLSSAILTTSALCVLLPPCAYIGGWMLVCLNRMLQGVTQGFVYPSIFTMMGLWIPIQERGRVSGLTLGAQNMGPVIATPLAGWLAAHWGWPSIFYSYGVIGVISSVVIFKYGADSPSAHAKISDEERAYVQTSLGGEAKKFPVPWRDILLSSPAWAAIMTMALQGGVFLTFLTKIPTYLSSVLKFDIQDNGVLTAVPYLASWLLSFVFAWACDWLVKGNYLNLTQARKVLNSISHVGSGFTMILLGYCTNTALSIALLSSSIGLMSASYPGVQSNFMDLAPNMSGTIFAVSNFLSAICGVAGPIIVSFIVTEKGSILQWRTVYFLCSAVMFLSGIHFVMCGSAEVQPWNFPEKTKQDFGEEGGADLLSKDDGEKLPSGGSES